MSSFIREINTSIGVTPPAATSSASLASFVASSTLPSCDAISARARSTASLPSSCASCNAIFLEIRFLSSIKFAYSVFLEPSLFRGSICDKDWSMAFKAVLSSPCSLDKLSKASRLVSAFFTSSSVEAVFTIMSCK